MVCARSWGYPKRYRRELRLLRRRPAEGRRRFFLGARPGPKKIAGYVPAAPLETGRAPAPLPVPAPPPAPLAQAYPPQEPFFFPPQGGFNPPGVLVVPPLPPIAPPPCEEGDDDCTPPPPPPPPPEEMPEPGTLFILMAGAAALWLGWRPKMVKKARAKR